MRFLASPVKHPLYSDPPNADSADQFPPEDRARKTASGRKPFYKGHFEKFTTEDTENTEFQTGK
jgi:hypothetical protein